MSNPIRYHCGMTMQIAVRLPEDLVGFVDQEVKDGFGSSRAAVVGRALERERRRRIAERDAEILQVVGGHDDLDGLVGFAAPTSLEID